MRKDKVQLIKDGHEAKAMLDAGFRPRDVLYVIGGSRARLYRALKFVESETSVTDSIKTETNP